MRPRAKLLVAMVGVALLIWGVHQWRKQAAPAAVALDPPAEPARVAPLAPAAATAVAGPLHPIEAESAASDVPAADLQSRLALLVGREAASTLFQTDDFVHRLVATVDNLGRTHAPSRLWPLNPARGDFVVAAQAGSATIAAANGGRYAAYVTLLEQLDLQRSVSLYRSLYPALQQAYEQLGFSHGYFNDRLVEVIDLLLAAPEPPLPPAVHRPQINGLIGPATPWLVYEFDDPTLEALPAGQKILVRIGLANERRIKARLRELRPLLTAGDRAH